MAGEQLPSAQEQDFFSSRQAIEMFENTQGVLNEMGAAVLAELRYELCFNELLARLKQLGVAPGSEPQCHFLFRDGHKRRHELLVSPFVMHPETDDEGPGLRLTFNIPGHDVEKWPGYKIHDYFVDLNNRNISVINTFAYEGRIDGKKVWWIGKDTGPYIGWPSGCEEVEADVGVMMGNLYLSLDVPDALKRLKKSSRHTGLINQAMRSLAVYSPIARNEVHSMHSEIIGRTS